jgi:hypothetical protein
MTREMVFIYKFDVYDVGTNPENPDQACIYVVEMRRKRNYRLTRCFTGINAIPHTSNRRSMRVAILLKFYPRLCGYSRGPVPLVQETRNRRRFKDFL